MMDDTGVPVIDGMQTKDGWRSASVCVRGRSEDVFVSPDGARYVRASEQERADLVARVNSKRFAKQLVVRLRLEQDSQLAHKLRREKRLVQKGEQMTRKVRRKGSFKGGSNA